MASVPNIPNFPPPPKKRIHQHYRRADDLKEAQEWSMQRAKLTAVAKAFNPEGAERGHRKPLIPAKEPRPWSDEARKYRKHRIG